jgi:methylenetetrahydrofolate reductase (NADPH)
MTSRFEIMPFGAGIEQAAEMPEHVRLTVTCSPKHGPDLSVDVGTQLRTFGHEVTIHLCSRMVRDHAHLDELLARMAEAGIDDVFLVGGDAPEPLGEFSSAVQLMPLVK